MEKKKKSICYVVTGKEKKRINTSAIESSLKHLIMVSFRIKDKLFPALL